MIYLHTYDLGKVEKDQGKKILIKNLSKYLGKEIGFSDIRYNKNGKPETDGIHFSISHSKTRLIQAFTKKQSIGVDIEFINPKRKTLALAKRYFHLQESQWLASLSGNDASTFFFQLWTKKEAVCKAHGGRLWYYLQDNYLDDENQMTTLFKGLTLTQLGLFKDYSISLACSLESPKIDIIHD